MAMSPFSQKVIKATRAIPKGNVASYGQIALIAGVPRAAIQVGWVLHQHGDKPGVPWWRVINNAGRISTKCVEHNANLQRTLLQKENITVTKGLKIDIEKYRWRPEPSSLKKLQLDNDYIERILDKYGI